MPYFNKINICNRVTGSSHYSYFNDYKSDVIVYNTQTLS